MSEIFQLCWGDYDSWSEYFFLAPPGATEEGFKSLCDSLLPEAVRQLLQFNGWDADLEDREERSKKDSNWIGWSNIVEELAHQLPKYGYERTKLPQVAYCGTSIIRENDFNDNDWDERGKAQIALLKETHVLVCEHNNKVEEGLKR
jgi:hypothetical protein